MNRKLWVVLIAVWLVVWGLLSISNFAFEGQRLVMGVLAIAAGVLALLDR